MLFERLSENNFLLYATKCYESEDPAGVTEFNKDIRILVYVKKLLRKYITTQDIKERLAMNHIIILNNVFGPTATTRMLFFYCASDMHSALKTILIYLDLLPAQIPEVDLPNIQLDKNLVAILHKI